jgi:hypothetical protein
VHYSVDCSALQASRHLVVTTVCVLLYDSLEEKTLEHIIHQSDSRFLVISGSVCSIGHKQAVQSRHVCVSHRSEPRKFKKSNRADLQARNRLALLCVLLLGTNAVEYIVNHSEPTFLVFDSAKMPQLAALPNITQKLCSPVDPDHALYLCVLFR